jgi:hypothetical protein
MADLKVMGFRTIGKTIDIAMLFQDFFNRIFLKMPNTRLEQRST